MKLTIDRIYGEIAVVIADDGKTFDVPTGILSDAKEGNIYDIRLDSDEMNLRAKRIEKLSGELWK